MIQREKMLAYVSNILCWRMPESLNSVRFFIWYFIFGYVFLFNNFLCFCILRLYCKNGVYFLLHCDYIESRLQFFTLLLCTVAIEIRSSFHMQRRVNSFTFSSIVGLYNCTYGLPLLNALWTGPKWRRTQIRSSSSCCSSSSKKDGRKKIGIISCLRQNKRWNRRKWRKKNDNGTGRMGRENK